MLTVSLTPPDEGAMVADVSIALERVGRDIALPGEYTQASSELAAIKLRAKELDELRKSIVKPLDEAREKVQALFRRPLLMLAKGEETIKEKMLAYQREQARVQAEKQRAIDEAARKERARLAEEAAKVAAKAREQAEQARRMAELAEQARQRAVAEGNARKAAASAALNAKLAERADSLELAGKEKAQELQTISDLVVAPTVASEVPKVAGQHSRKTWKAEVTDHGALIRDIADKPQYANVLPPDQAVLNKLAVATGGKLQLAGVLCYEVDTLIARAAR